MCVSEQHTVSHQLTCYRVQISTNLGTTVRATRALSLSTQTIMQQNCALYALLVRTNANLTSPALCLSIPRIPITIIH